MALIICSDAWTGSHYYGVHVSDSQAPPPLGGFNPIYPLGPPLLGESYLREASSASAGRLALSEGATGSRYGESRNTNAFFTGQGSSPRFGLLQH